MKTILILIGKITQLSIVNICEIPENIRNKAKFVLIINSNLQGQIEPKLLSSFDKVIYTPVNSASVYDEQELYANVTLVCKEYSNIHAFVPDEMNVDIAEQVLAKFNIPGWGQSTGKLCRDKVLMKEHMLKHGIRVPKFMPYTFNTDFNSLCDEIGLPFVLKPVDSCGSIGVYIIRNQEEYNQFLQIPDNYENYEVEEYIDGILYHVDSIKYEDQFFATVGRYSHPLAQALDGKVVGAIEIPDNNPLYEKLIKFNYKVVESFNNDGCYHHELFVTKNGEIIFLEIGWRACGAPNYAIFAQHYGFYQTILSIILNIDGKAPIAPQKDNYRLEFLVPKKLGIYNGIKLPSLCGKAQIEHLIELNTNLEHKPALYSDACAKITITYPTFDHDYDLILSDFNTLCGAQLYG